MNWSPDKYKEAWNFATLAHRGQTYGGWAEGMTIDYLNHIGSVAMEVMWALPATPDYDADLALQCALLHDTLEDTATTYADVLAQFGQPVAAGVLALTKNDTLPNKQAQMADSLARIQQQLPEIWLVKMADRITNLYHPPYYWDNKKIEAYRREAILIYEALHPASLTLAGRLWEKIEAYQQFLM
jgi:(p)ppGpp synthase/HD superfamily hydrolase